MTRRRNDIQAEDLRPKLRLHHLFALTAVMAVLLAIQGPQRKDVNRDVVVAPLHIVPAEWGMWGVVYQILAAAAITVLVYGIADYRRGLTFFSQPGHWILVEIAVSTALVFPCPLALSLGGLSTNERRNWPVMLMWLFGHRIDAVALFWVASCSIHFWRENAASDVGNAYFTQRPLRLCFSSGLIFL